MNNLRCLLDYFLDGSAETEREIRSEVFVQTRDIRKFLLSLKHNFSLLVSAKGIGKSFLLEEMNDTALSEGNISLLIHPKDIDMEAINQASVVSSKISVAYNELVKLIAIKLSEHIPADVPISKEEINIFRVTYESGEKRPPLAFKLFNLLSILLPHSGKIASSLNALAPKLGSANVLRGDILSILSGADKKLFLLIDDIDQAAVHHSMGIKYENSWAIVAAAFDLSNEIRGIKSVVSVRNDVWHTMMERRKLGVDRRDKIRNSIFTLRVTGDDVSKILNKRLKLAAKACGCDCADVYDCFFRGKVILPGVKSEKRPWTTWLATASRRRPRDLVQLIKKLAERAKLGGKSHIESNHAEIIMLEFAKDRLSNIDDEYIEVCPKLKMAYERILTKDCFTFEEIVEELRKVPSDYSFEIDGETLKTTTADVEIAIKILWLLHMATIVTPRLQDSYAQRGFKHVYFDDEPNFVAIGNLNTLRAAQWEIHPVFHSYIAEKRAAMFSTASWKK